MPASKKPRKKYVPGATDGRAVERKRRKKLNAMPVSETCQSLQVRNHEALLAITTGAGTSRHWHDVTEALNVATVLSETIFDRQYLPEILEAAVAHARCGARLHKVGRLGYTGEELRAVNRAMDVHDAQLDEITFGELTRAHDEVKRRAATQPTLTPHNVEERAAEYAATADHT